MEGLFQAQRRAQVRAEEPCITASACAVHHASHFCCRSWRQCPGRRAPGGQGRRALLPCKSMCAVPGLHCRSWKGCRARRGVLSLRQLPPPSAPAPAAACAAPAASPDLCDPCMQAPCAVSSLCSSLCWSATAPWTRQQHWDMASTQQSPKAAFVLQLRATAIRCQAP